MTFHTPPAPRRLDGTSKPERRRAAPHAARCAAVFAATLLAGCVSPPPQGTPGQIISRLPSSSGAAAVLSDAERARYQQIDKQVMADQDARNRARAWVDAIAAIPVYYSGYSYYYGPYSAYPALYPVYPAYAPYPAYPPSYPIGPGW